MVDEQRFLCMICMVFVGVTGADAMTGPELEEHVRLKHTRKEAAAVKELRRLVRGE